MCIFGACLQLPEVLVDVFDVVAAEHGVVVVLGVHVPDGGVKHDVGKRLAEVGGRTARGLHRRGGCRFGENLEITKEGRSNKRPRNRLWPKGRIENSPAPQAQQEQHVLVLVVPQRQEQLALPRLFWRRLSSSLRPLASQSKNETC